MMMPAMVPLSPSAIPGKIQAAMDYLRFAQSLETGPIGYGGDEWKQGAGRELNRRERAVYDAALDALLTYFQDAPVDQDQSVAVQGGNDYGQPVSIIA